MGTVLAVADGVATISGLSQCLAGELLEFPGGIVGLALNLEEDSVGAVILGDYLQIEEGAEVPHYRQGGRSSGWTRAAGARG